MRLFILALCSWQARAATTAYGQQPELTPGSDLPVPSGQISPEQSGLVGGPLSSSTSEVFGGGSDSSSSSGVVGGGGTSSSSSVIGGDSGTSSSSGVVGGDSGSSSSSGVVRGGSSSSSGVVGGHGLGVRDAVQPSTSSGLVPSSGHVMTLMDQETLQQAAKEIDSIEQILLKRMGEGGASLPTSGQQGEQVAAASALPEVLEVSEQSDSQVSPTVSEGSSYLPAQAEGQQVGRPGYGFGYGGYFPPQRSLGAVPFYGGVKCAQGRSVEKRTADPRADPCFWLGGGFGWGGYTYGVYPGLSLGYGGYWG